MRTAEMAEPIQVKFYTTTALLDVVIYLKRHANWSRGFREVGLRFLPLPLTFPMFLTLRIAHTRDVSLINTFLKN